MVLVDTDLPATVPMSGESPCAGCADQTCVTACPAGALDECEFSLQKCIAYRRRPESRCRITCVARTSCPVRPEHRYTDAQIAHSYSRSLAMIEALGNGRRHSGASPTSPSSGPGSSSQAMLNPQPSSSRVASAMAPTVMAKPIEF